MEDNEVNQGIDCVSGIPETVKSGGGVKGEAGEGGGPGTPEGVVGVPSLAINKSTVNIKSLCLESTFIGPSYTLEGSAGSVRIMSQENATHTQ